MKSYDYVVVGSGLTGAVIARLLADHGREVIVLERRNHVGGNTHDHTHESGIRIHTYGPHYFRTSCPRIWDYCIRFGSFYPYVPRILTYANSEYVHWPLGISFLRSKMAESFQPCYKGVVTNFEEAALSLMPRAIYEVFVKEYNEKQWGVPASKLSADLCKRFDVRLNDDTRLTPNAIYQGIPTKGYHAWMMNMLSDIPILINYEYETTNLITAKRCLIYTGPIDAYFNYDLGRLEYRSQKRVSQYFPSVRGYYQSSGQINNPQHSNGEHIRTLEWKHMMETDYASNIIGTVITTETPYTPTNANDYEYPFPDSYNALLYNRYRSRADALEKTIICGRLGEYRYYDMDQAIARAMVIAKKIISQDT